MALSTVAAVKTQAGIPQSDTSRDEQFASLLAGITAALKSDINRDLEQQTYTEYYSGDGSQTLILRQYPVQSITSIYLDSDGYWGFGSGSFASATLLVEGTDYALKRSSSSIGSGSGIVQRIGGNWPMPSRRVGGFIADQVGIGVGNIKVVYVAGYATIPADLQMAVNELVIRKANSAAFGMSFKQGQYEDANATFMTPEEMRGLVGSIESVLSSYREVAI